MLCEIIFLVILFLFFCIIYLQFNKIEHKLPKSDEADNLILHLKTKGDIFVKFLLKKYSADEGIILLSQRFNPEKLYEGNPYNEEFTYTENKGEKIVICVRNSDNLQVHSENLVMYPFIHELAHLCDKNFDPTHGENFQKYFKILINEAQIIGLYKPIDFNKHPTKYCNMTIT